MTVRRTQAERRAETRAKLLDATLECLVEHGFVGTTAARIVERAGVTRGAQTHYFRTVEELLVAAVDHLAERRAEEALGLIAELATAEDPIGSILDMIWELHNDELYVATIELWVAARSNEALRRHVGAVETSALGPLRATIAGLVPDPQLRAAVTSFLFTAMDTVRGLRLGVMAGDPAAAAERWDRARRDLYLLAEAKIAHDGFDLEALRAVATAALRD